MEKAEILRELGGIPEDVYDALVEEFMAGVGKGISDIEEAVENDGWQQVRRVAHSMKGSSANLRLHKIRDLFSCIEESAEEGGDRDAVLVNLEKLKRLLRP